MLSEAYFGVGIKFVKSDYLTYEYNDITGYLPVGKSLDEARPSIYLGYKFDFKFKTGSQGKAD